MLLRPHFKNFGKRLIKSPKIYFLDSGLLCYLLGVRTAADLHRHASRGAIFESFVLSELVKNFANRGERPGLYFWRDSAGREIDFLADSGGRLVAVEAKSGKTVAGDFFGALKFWRDLNQDPSAPAALVYGGDRAFRQSGFAVYPWFAI